MKLPRRQFLHLAAGAATLPAVSRIARAQSYPNHTITMVVPFAAGGSTDVTAGIIAEHMSRTLGRQVLIENVVGAGGTTGTARTMRATPDGYTIMMGQLGTHALSVALYPNLAYRPDVDFAPIGRAVDQAMLIVSRKDFPAKDLGEFISYIKANATSLNAGHAGIGSITHGTASCLVRYLASAPQWSPSMAPDRP
jgi:tripartite-type tricarboxylate transporter receptor subunit TctC